MAASARARSAADASSCFFISACSRAISCSENWMVFSICPISWLLALSFECAAST
eukprot:CAMPEP_0206404474 /NCGR_PEP_ID=MMETSP0294-20121207/28410_1 /ASSEMBLY_ACC=CAM_ASM_000327 /TAXON_ID=39354 /ORGANISM="Heterosigma akashiwo, Strain CCMP2393" /LENGTH=54 /DNA_ID=CAMNT_0053862419 /DNA_START=60 /DNA_END=224 /DNA_ORIENTATION=+